MKTKAQSFINEVLARIQGDEDKVVAERNSRKAVAAVKGQISSLENKKVDAEVSLDEAKENLHAVKYPITPIKDISDYVRGIANAQKKVDEAEEALVEVNESLDYFTELLESFNKKA